MLKLLLITLLYVAAANKHSGRKLLSKRAVATVHPLTSPHREWGVRSRRTFWFKKTFKKIGNSIVDGIKGGGKVVDGAVDGVTGVVDDVTDVATDVTDVATDVTDVATDVVTDVVDDVVDGVVDCVTDPLECIKKNPFFDLIPDCLMNGKPKECFIKNLEDSAEELA